MMQFVEQAAVAFAEAGHLLDHVGELGDVERGDRSDLSRPARVDSRDASASDVRH